MEDFWLIVITIIAGILFGIIAVISGIGGGMLFVPYLDFVVNVGLSATIISTFVILLTASSGSINYHLQNRIDKRTAYIYLTLAIPSSILGRVIKEFYIEDVKMMRLLFGILIGTISLINIIRILLISKPPIEEKVITEITNKKRFSWIETREFTSKDGKSFKYEVNLGVGSLLTLVGGLIAGMLGIGGGLIFVPVLTSVSGLPIHIAVATSTYMIVFVSIAVLITYAILGNNLLVVFQWGIPLGIGTIIGARIGASRAKKIESKYILTFFWIVAFSAAVRMGIGSI
jgi:uncharacterized protein